VVSLRIVSQIEDVPLAFIGRLTDVAEIPVETRQHEEEDEERPLLQIPE
jgi:hypothetical protein